MFLTVISGTGVRKRIPLTTLLMQNQLSSIEGVSVCVVVLSTLVFYLSLRITPILS